MARHNHKWNKSGFKKMIHYIKSHGRRKGNAQFASRYRKNRRIK